MNADPIIEELHRIRKEIAAQFNYDVFAIGASLRAEQQNEDRPVVSFGDQPGEPEGLPMEIIRISAFRERMEAKGLAPKRKPAPPAGAEPFQPIEVQGKPLSEVIIEERR